MSSSTDSFVVANAVRKSLQLIADLPDSDLDQRDAAIKGFFAKLASETFTLEGARAFDALSTMILGHVLS